jgi:RNA polymerase sigma-70 factor (ECF subfamily)
MAPPAKIPPSSAANRGRFATTRWSIVLDAGRTSSAGARRALAELCEIYWYPLYAFMRRRGLDEEDARDLTQDFFAELLAKKKTLRVADRQRGRFRSFLLASAANFLANERRKASARKRGGDCRLLSLDFSAGERRYALEPFHHLTAEKIYERRWAMTLLEQVLGRLRMEATAAGKLPQFDLLTPYLGGSRQTVPYANIAGQLQATEGAVKVAVHRLRQRCRALLREEIAHTVADPADIDDELRSLFATVRGE